jgi:hypothetical protein
MPNIVNMLGVNTPPKVPNVPVVGIGVGDVWALCFPVSFAAGVIGNPVSMGVGVVDKLNFINTIHNELVTGNRICR